MHNTGSQTSEVYLIDPASNAVYGEIEGLAPGTTRTLTATIGSGDYAWRCVPTGGKAVTSAAVHVSGGGTTKAVLPVAESDLAAPLAQYKAYVDAGLAALQGQTAKLAADLRAGDLAAAKADWLTAHTQYASSAPPTAPSRTSTRRSTAVPTACPTASTTRTSPASCGSSTASTTASPPPRWPRSRTGWPPT
ncbi:imelysin family protein [Streptacidiphilus monticola]